MTACWRTALAAMVALTMTAAGHAQSATPVTATNKRCDAAEKRIAREKRDLASTLLALGRERKARETCPTRSGCTRIDQTIASLEKRHHRLEVRLVRSRADALEVCRPPPTETPVSK